MSRPANQVEAEVGGPAGVRWQAFLREAAATLPHDALVLGVLDAQAPSPDGFLAVHGVERQVIVEWCDEAHRSDELWRDACRDGRVLASDGRPRGLPLPRRGHCLVQTLPASLDQRRVWLLAAFRRSRGFDATDDLRAALLLRLKQLEFDHCAEPGLGRLLLDSQDRLLHADPVTESWILNDAGRFAAFTRALRQVILQRWPQGLGAEAHDVFLDVDGQPTWARLHESSPVPGMPRHTYVELRPLGPEDPPPVGVLSDDRIARALGYITDRYRQGPTLTEAAAEATISPFHFHRVFTRDVGASPKHFLLRMQMLIAKWRLATTRQPINQIAAATGFASHGHFTATFHRLVGMSPTDYREKNRA